MSEPKKTGSSRMLFSMAGIGTLCALLIVLTYEGTLPRVERLRAEALQQAIFKVLPGISETRAFQLDTNEMLTENEVPNAPTIHIGYDENGELKGIAIEAEGQGYADKIKILYGYDPNAQTVIGFYVLETKETPGLGDKIEKDETFLANFKSLDVSLNDLGTGLLNAVITVKNGEKSEEWQVEGITGATISSRTIGAIINESTNYWGPISLRNMDKIMSQPNEPSNE
jgi:electron transport complex protein RnfG